MTEKAKDINEQNQEFWSEIQKKVDPLLSKPELVSESLDDLHDQSRRGLISVVSLEYTLLRNAEKAKKRESARQSSNASHTRQRKRGHREIAIEVMRKAKREQMSYKQFMAAEWEEISFAVLPGAGQMSYKVYCGVLQPQEENDSRKAEEAATKLFSDKTIQGWWAVAGKEKS